MSRRSAARPLAQSASSAERLVEQQQPGRTARDRASAVRWRSSRTGWRQPVRSPPARRGRAARGPRARARPGPRPQPQRVADVARDRQVPEEPSVLEHQGEPALVGRYAGQVGAVPADPPGRGRLENRRPPAAAWTCRTRWARGRRARGRRRATARRPPRRARRRTPRRRPRGPRRYRHQPALQGPPRTAPGAVHDSSSTTAVVAARDDGRGEGHAVVHRTRVPDEVEDHDRQGRVVLAGEERRRAELPSETANAKPGGQRAPASRATGRSTVAKVRSGPAPSDAAACRWRSSCRRGPAPACVRRAAGRHQGLGDRHEQQLSRGGRRAAGRA